MKKEIFKFLGCFYVFAVCFIPAFVYAGEVIQKEGSASQIILQTLDEDVYKLSVNDRIRLTVFGEDDLSGEFDIDRNGYVSLPLIGRVFVAGLSLEGAKESIVKVFKDGFLVDPKLTLDVLTFQPFYILGEVKSPGSYSYSSGLTVLNAIALAGGYTYRADKGDIEIQREKMGKKEKFDASEKTVVMPGDVITVDERFF